MNLKIHVSGSSGNLYTLEGRNSPPLMIECGLPIVKIRKHLNLNDFRQTGCLISHTHKDHAESAAKLEAAGIRCWSNYETAAALGISGTLYCTDVGHSIAVAPRTIGGFNVLALDGEHDVRVSLFVIDEIATGERLLFATDTCLIPYSVKGLTQIAIDCNYDIVLVEDFSRLPRLRESHMSIDDVVSFLDKADLSKVTKIHLLHISSSNGDDAGFTRRIQNRYGIPVYTK